KPAAALSSDWDLFRHFLCFRPGRLRGGAIGEIAIFPGLISLPGHAITARLCGAAELEILFHLGPSNDIRRGQATLLFRRVVEACSEISATFPELLHPSPGIVLKKRS